MGKLSEIVRQNKLQWVRLCVVVGGLFAFMVLASGCGGRVIASDQAAAPTVAARRMTPAPAYVALAPAVQIVATETPAATPAQSGGESPLAVPSAPAAPPVPATHSFRDREAISIITARAAQRAQMGFLAPAPPVSPTPEAEPGTTVDAPVSPLAPPAADAPNIAVTVSVTAPVTAPVGTPAVFLPALPHAPGEAVEANQSTAGGVTLGRLATPSPESPPVTSPFLLPTPTPTANPLNLAELLAQPVPGAPGNPDPTATAVPAAPPVAAVPTPALPPPPPLEPTPVWAQGQDGTVRSARVPIFMYHYLSDPPPGADIYRVDLSVSPQRFGAHLDALRANGYTTISLYQLHAHLTQGAPLPEKPVVLTFDDGYRDNYVNAFPQLRDRGMVATFFVNTDFINDGVPAYLTWDMVREMYAAGMSIEAHGRNHTSLKDRDTDYLVWQALGNLEAIEQAIGVRPRFISYPAGQYDQRTIEIFASANYWMGATTVQGATHSSDRLFELQRVRVRNTTTVEELLRLAALDW